jgi:hypothetical protein
MDSLCLFRMSEQQQRRDKRLVPRESSTYPNTTGSQFITEVQLEAIRFRARGRFAVLDELVYGAVKGMQV